MVIIMEDSEEAGLEQEHTEELEVAVDTQVAGEVMPIIHNNYMVQVVEEDRITVDLIKLIY